MLFSPKAIKICSHISWFSKNPICTKSQKFFHETKISSAMAGIWRLLAVFTWFYRPQKPPVCLEKVQYHQNPNFIENISSNESILVICFSSKFQSSMFLFLFFNWRGSGTQLYFCNFEKYIFWLLKNCRNSQWLSHTSISRKFCEDFKSAIIFCRKLQI